MRAPFPECIRRPEFDERGPFQGQYGLVQAGWFYGPEGARASIVAGDGMWGDGITTWEVWYPGDDEPTPSQTAADIAKRMGRKETATPVWL
jgi:hypothetical protein